MGLIRGCRLLSGLSGGCSPVSCWHTPRSRDPELAARQRPELYRAPGAGGEAPPRRRLQEGGGRSAPLGTGVPPPRWGPRSISSPRLGPSSFHGLGGHRWQGPRAVGGPSLGTGAAHPGAGEGAASAWAPWAEPRAPGAGGGHMGDTDLPGPSCRGGLILWLSPGLIISGRSSPRPALKHTPVTPPKCLRRYSPGPHGIPVPPSNFPPGPRAPPAPGRRKAPSPLRARVMPGAELGANAPPQR